MQYHGHEIFGFIIPLIHLLNMNKVQRIKTRHHVIKMKMLRAHAQMGGPIWVPHKLIMPCGCHCNAHVVL
jgi:hypothetical protein